jgi:hypothetical protein
LANTSTTRASFESPTIRPVKKPYYARIGVSYHWLVDLEARTITAYHLESNRWVELGTWGDEEKARIDPFGEAPLDVSAWWP